MNNPPIPLKLAMARVIARRIIENPGVLGLDKTTLERLQIFMTESWDTSWADMRYNGWEGSFYWKRVGDKLPEILAKLAEIDGH
jgi:hypothetical protein